MGIVGEGEVDLVVRPSARGKGIGRSTLDMLLASDDGTHQGELRAWAHGENAAANALLSAAGFTPVRELLRLSLDPSKLAGAIERARPLAEGFEVFPFDPSNNAQADDWVRVNARAFASHPEQGAVTRADFDTLTHEPWFLAEDLRLAYSISADSAGELAGFTWVKTVAEGESVDTELYVLGVDPSFSGRGCGGRFARRNVAAYGTSSPRSHYSVRRRRQYQCG